MARKAKRPRHRFLYDDRGVGHRFRFRPSCSCGNWAGHYQPTLEEAATSWRAHRENATDDAARQARRHSPPGPRPLTPHDQLPKELQ